MNSNSRLDAKYIYSLLYNPFVLSNPWPVCCVPSPSLKSSLGFVPVQARVPVQTREDDGQNGGPQATRCCHHRRR